MAIRTQHQISDPTWFITFTFYNWLSLFNITSSYDLVYNWFKIIKLKYSIRICGFVIMPNHVHALLYLQDENINLNHVIVNGKRFMAYEIVKRLQYHPNILTLLANACTVQEKTKGQLHKVFEPSFDAKPVYSYSFFQQKLTYIHHNPVSGKWNLCDEFSDYEDSSASYYHDGNLLHRDIVTDYRELDKPAIRTEIRRDCFVPRNDVFMILAAFLILLTIPSFAQQTYTADISKTQAPIITGHLKLGKHTNAAGHTIDANSLFFIKDGKPWYPVMGEFHFSRYPKARWEESILRMKANGIDVIATYVFWIYHEEEEGKYDWTGNHDLRYFIELCKKHNISVLTRIGPWCHGEVRNGGFPDWIVKRGNMRKNNPEYLASVQKLYDAIAGQLKGLYFKDGGPIIGTQIENEFRFNNPTGLEHMFTLKKMAVKAGIDVPFYTATGWPGSNLKQDELVPVWGAYPEAPWDKKTTQLALSENYIFSTLRNDPAIGSDLLGKHEEDAASYTGYRYPYATAEMGGGIQITYHRRPIIEPVDVAALAYVKVGAGANLMGYYMFHGGHNEIGKLSTLQESKATNYPNDYPILNYDFQAPLGEFGQVRPSYHSFKVIHTFLNNFGDRLVQYYPSFPDQKALKPNDSTTLRFTVRSKGNSGFVFISNYQRQLKLKDQQGVQFNLKLASDKSISFPEKGIDIKEGVQAILPFNMDIEGSNLRYATVQPLCKIPGSVPTYVFFAPDGIRPEYVFDKAGITKIDATQTGLQTRTDSYLINNIQPGTSGLITLSFSNGKKVNILTLTHQQALDSWMGNALGGEHLFISKQNLTFAGGKLKMQSSGDADFSVAVYPAVKVKAVAGFGQSADGVFTKLSKILSAKTIKVGSNEVSNITFYDKNEDKLPLDDRNSKNTAVSPGPQYQTNITTVNSAKYWVLTVPALIQNALLDIDYRGDTGAAYIDGKLVADDFYFGKTMQLYLPKSSVPKRILLQVIPLTDERQIYFEKGIREPLQGKSVAELKGVKVILQYEVEL